MAKEKNSCLWKELNPCFQWAASHLTEWTIPASDLVPTKIKYQRRVRCMETAQRFLLYKWRKEGRKRYVYLTQHHIQEKTIKDKPCPTNHRPVTVTSRKRPDQNTWWLNQVAFKTKESSTIITVQRNTYHKFQILFIYIYKVNIKVQFVLHLLDIFHWHYCHLGSYWSLGNCPIYNALLGSDKNPCHLNGWIEPEPSASTHVHY